MKMINSLSRIGGGGYKKITLIGVTIILLLIIPIYYVSRNNTTSNIQLDDVRIKEENRKRLAIMVKESDNEDYKSYEGSTWPINYIYKRSECIDSNGTITEVDVRYENNNIIINTSKTVYCTIYFDKDTKAPEINNFYIIQNPTPLYTNISTGKVKVTMTWEDSDVSSYCINTSKTIDGCTWEPTNNNNQITKEIQLSEGRNNIYGYIKDKAENISSEKEGSIILDTKSPVVTNAVDNNPQENSLNIVIIANDINNNLEVSGIDKYCYARSDSDNVGDYTCNTSPTITISELQPGTSYDFWIYATDKALNGSPADRKNFTITTKEQKLGGNYVDGKVTGDNVGSGGYGPSGATGVTDPLAKRFYGTNPNNYICFGAASCSNNDDHMYRIIGATSDGKLKIMKQKQLSSNQYWHTTTGVTWEGAKLRSDINDSLFYNNTNLVSADYKQYIDPNPQWCLGDVQSYSTGSEVLQKEMATCKEITTSPIGLMYLSDYYFAYNGKGSTNCNSNVCKSWMTLGSYEWTMSRNSSGSAWRVSNNGFVSNYYLGNARAVRPVFYLISSVKLSGSGSNTDPFIITA